MIEPALLRGRDRYERLMHGWVDATGEDAVTHTVRLDDPDGALEVTVVALPSPTYAIREARCRARHGVDPTVAVGFAALEGTAMVAGFTRAVAEAVGHGRGAGLAVDAAIEVARLARQVARLPRERAERAALGARDCWELDVAGWIDLPDSCFTYTEAGRALLGTRTVAAAMNADLYSPLAGMHKVFERRKAARLERTGPRLVVSHSMHDNVHGFEVHYEIDLDTERIVRAESTTSRLPYAGICSEPQGKVRALEGEAVDAGLRKRLGALVGGPTGCAQLYDLTSDLVRLLAAAPAGSA